ncbi:hypothetical protein G7054_g1050 [Neopestalotiopsis clavispora]|nr:hypothetical protein G7054_g1050 [Neopestalotiopsis clavispora]
MDPVSLSLGILPLVVGAIKSYSKVKEKLDVFRHYSREIKRVRKQLDTERRVFLNETRILVLTAVEDRLLVTQMLDDPENPQWYNKTAEAAFRNILVDSYDEYTDEISSISDTIQEMQTELACFNLFASQQHEDERLTETIYRVRDRVKIALNKTRLDKSLDELKESNGNLQRLGKQMRKIKEITSEIPIIDGLKKQLPQEYADFGMVRRASKAFHSALASAWSSQADTCQRLAVSQHNVRFFLDTKVLDSVSMDLVVVCPGHMTRETNVRQNFLAPRPLRIQVKSQITPCVDTGLQSPPASISSASPTAEESQPKRRRVRSQKEGTECANTEPLTEHLERMVTKDLDTPNLLSQDLCSFLQHTCPGDALDKCVGYLESYCNETFRHSIYPSISSAHNLQQVVSVEKVLDRLVGKNVSPVDQLNLARSLVAAVLKFHSTPWLAQYLTVRDILLLQNSEDFAECIPTLHFDTSFEDAHTTEPTSDAFEDARLDHGIRNMTIGQWSCLAEPDNVREVRLRSWTRTGISPKYEELTRRCLNCDFGYGEDLTRPRLQQAVYEKVYCELVSMIDVMSISED